MLGAFFVRSDLPFRLERSAKRQFGALSRLEQKHCFCAAKTFARLDRANDDLPFRLNRSATIIIEVWQHA